MYVCITKQFMGGCITMGKKRLISTLLHLLAGKSSTPLVVYFPSPVLPLIEHASQTHGTFLFLSSGQGPFAP